MGSTRSSAAGAPKGAQRRMAVLLLAVMAIRSRYARWEHSRGEAVNARAVLPRLRRSD